MATVPFDQPSNRILTLDVIRGVAVMGIFSVNVVGFAMVEAAYFHPPAYGWNGLADRLMWLANFVLIDGKMRSLFSMLFGASMLLVAERAEAVGESPVAVHYRRMIVPLLAPERDQPRGLRGHRLHICLRVLAVRRGGHEPRGRHPRFGPRERC
jgi:uncharacterized membrane protein YeiB